MEKKRRKIETEDSQEEQEETIQIASQSSTSPVEQNEEEQEREQEELLQQFTQTQQARQRRKLQHQEPAECGIIQNVTLVDFMCHKYLTINLVIGHNGSGKSAILTGITVCLGGKASSTNRANSLKGLIREGAEKAEITVKLKNEGKDAFKPDVYGDCITVQRTVSKTGGSDCKIKNSFGKVVSKQKSELTAICDHMAIQPDNPLLILSQDNARQFLASSTPEDRYKLFLRGTQLQQLLDDYNEIRDNMQRIQRLIDEKMKVMPDLEAKCKVAESKWKQMEAAQNLEVKIEGLKKQIAWSQVYDAFEQASKAENDITTQEYKIAEVDREIDSRSNQMQTIKAEIGELLQKLEAEKNNGAPILRLQDAIGQELNSLKSQFDDAIKSERDLNDQITREKNEMRNLERMVQEEQQKLDSSNSGSLLVEAKNRLNLVHRDLESEKHALEQLQAKANSSETHGELESLDKAISDGKMQKERLEREMEKLNSDINEISHSGNNRLKLFGAGISHMLQDIEAIAQKGGFVGGRPIGPIGMHVRMSDSKWAYALDGAIGPRIPFAFIVQNQSDVKTLQKLFERYQYGTRGQGRNVNYHEIIVARYDPKFEYSSGLPPQDPRYTTILDVLQIDNDLVKQALINNFSIESVILVERRQIGVEVTRQWPRNVSSCFDVDANKIGHRGRGNANFNRKQSGNSAFGNLCAADHREILEKLKVSVSLKHNDWRSLSASLQQSQQRYDQVRMTFERSKQALHNQVQKCKDLQRRYQVLQAEVEREELNSAPVEDNRLASLMEEKNEILATIEKIKAQFVPLAEVKTRIKREIDAKKAEFMKMDAERKKVTDMCDEITRNLMRLKDSEKQLVSDQSFYATQKTKYEGILTNAKSNHDRLLSSAQEKEQIALEYCDGQRIAKNSIEYPSTEAIDSAIKQATVLLRQKEKELGSLEEAANDFREKKESLQRTKSEIQSNAEIFKTLRKALTDRKNGWLSFRSSICVRASHYFITQLERRNYSGNLKFDHKNMSLHVTIRTDDPSNLADSHENSQRSVTKGKDPKNLSGGEKSFSTVCLLLSLWGAMYCPIRGLDEFDVFMDSVNRRVSMKMMIDSARANPQTQYILITPQSMQNMTVTSDIKVHKLADPKKLWADGQTTIQFQSESNS